MKGYCITQTKVTALGTRVTWRASSSCPDVLHVTLSTPLGRELELGRPRKARPAYVSGDLTNATD